MRRPQHLARNRLRDRSPRTGRQLTSRTITDFSALSKERPPEWEEPGPPADWIALFRLLVHPLKVAVVEALDQARQPLSATEIWLRVGMKSSTSEGLSYHVKTLATLGVLRATGQRRVRGAVETYYYFTPAFLQLEREGCDHFPSSPATHG